MDKLLSIIVPSYNMEKYLPKCLGSLIVDDAGLLQKLDVIVVNDGSKDRTSEIAHGFEAKYPGVFRVIDKPNGHYGSCINAALPVAQGTYMHMLDADDFVATHLFRPYLEWLQGADADVAINDWDAVGPEDQSCGQSWYSVFPTDAVFSPQQIPTGKSLLGVHALAYRTALLREMNYRQTEGVAYSDQEWMTLPMSRVRTARYYPQKVFRYLFGRADQSVNRDVFRQNRWMSCVVLTRLIEAYPKHSTVGTAEGCDYFRRAVATLCASFFWDVLAEGISRDSRFDLTALDDLIARQAPEVFAAIDSFRPSRRLPIRPIHEWRRHRDSHSFLLVLLRVYASASHVFGSVVKRARGLPPLARK